MPWNYNNGNIRISQILDLNLFEVLFCLKDLSVFEEWKQLSSVNSHWHMYNTYSLRCNIDKQDFKQTYCLSNSIKLYFIEYTYPIVHLTSWKRLVVKIHRYWHFMSTPSEYFKQVYLYVKAHILNVVQEAKQLPNILQMDLPNNKTTIFIHLLLGTCTAVYTKRIYIHRDSLLFTVFKINWMFWSMYQNSVWKNEFNISTACVY